METTYMSNMGPSPFYYYNPEAPVDQRQHGQFSPYPTGIPYFPHIVKSAQSTACAPYPAPDASMVFHHGFFPQQAMMTPLASPQPIYFRTAPLIERQSPHLHQLDTSFQPSTPPLSASGSAKSSPPSARAFLPTPSHGSFVVPEGFSGFKHEFGEEMLQEMLPHNNFMSPSPPLSPVYVFPTSGPIRNLPLAQSAAAKANAPASPSPSPLPPTSASEQTLTFCDPRDLTVQSPTSFNLSTPTQAQDNQFISPVQSVSSYDLPASASDFLGTSGLSNCDPLFGFDFDTEFSNFSKSGLPDNTIFTGQKRQRTGLLSIPEDETFVAEDSFSDVDDDTLASAWLLRPSDLEDSFRSDMSTVSTSSIHSPSTVPEVDSDDNYAAAENGASPTHGAQNSPTNGEGNNFSDGTMPSGSDEAGNGTPQSANRRGRKQSLTEDPSKTFICHLCNRRFRRQEHLKRHYRSLHTHDKPFKCEDCGKTFSRSDNLAQHQRTHGTGTISLEMNELGEHVHSHQEAESPESDSDRMAQILYQAAQRLTTSTTPESSGSSTDESDVSVNAAATEKKVRKRKRDE